jgi:two-component system OmpR family response regulator
MAHHGTGGAMDVRSVLLIDDAAEIRELVEIALAHIAGWTVTTAASGEEGLAAWITAQPDLILLDVQMPVMDGPAVLTLFRATGIETPIVFMTAETSPEALAHYREIGARGVVKKPFDPMTLADEVRRAAG